MKKRLLATVLAGAMVLSMAACGSSNANKTESAAASETANASTEAGAESGETQAAAQEGSLRLVIRNMPANKPVGITRELTK